MTFDNFILYQDDNLKIEIPQYIWAFLQISSNETIILTDKELNFILSQVFTRLKQEEIFLTNPILIRNIPIIKSGITYGFESPMNFFNKCFYYISDYNTLTYNEKAVEYNFKQTFKDVECQLFLFEHIIFNIKGFIIYKEKENNYICLFGFKENNQFY